MVETVGRFLPVCPVAGVGLLYVACRQHLDDDIFDGLTGREWGLWEQVVVKELGPEQGDRPVASDVGPVRGRDNVCKSSITMGCLGRRFRNCGT